jgi:hypothetical protein
MKINLVTWQRVTLTGILSNIEGKVQIVRKAAKLLDALELNAAEKELVGFVETAGNITWTDKEHRFEIEIGDPNLFAFLSEQVKTFTFPPQTWAGPEIRALILDLYDQLGIKDA